MYELYNIGTFRENTAEVFGCVTKQTQEFSLFAGRASYIEERTERKVLCIGLLKTIVTTMLELF